MKLIPFECLDTTGTIWVQPNEPVALHQRALMLAARVPVGKTVWVNDNDHLGPQGKRWVRCFRKAG